MHHIITTPRQAGEILRGRRKARRLSQQDLAAKLGISQAHLSTLEGNPAAFTLDRLIALANLLGLELVLNDRSNTATSGAEW